MFGFGKKNKKNVTQNERVLDYMKRHPHKGITNKDANNMDIERLSARIYNLRKMGYEIETKIEVRRNAYDEVKTYARYFYRGEKNDDNNGAN